MPAVFTVGAAGAAGAGVIDAAVVFPMVVAGCAFLCIFNT